MKRFLGILLVMVMALSAAAQEEVADTDSISVSGTAGVYSHYVWRGMVISNEPIVIPRFSASYNGLTLDGCAVVVMTDDIVDPYRIIKATWTAEYTIPVELLPMTDLSVGYLYHTYPTMGMNDTQEVFVKAAVDTILSPSAKVYWDVDEGGGLYCLAAIGHKVEIGEVLGQELALGLSASVGFGDENYNEFKFGAGTGSGFVDLLLGAAIPMDIGNGFTLTPSGKYMTVLDSDVRAARADSDAFYTGISLSKKF